MYGKHVLLVQQACRLVRGVVRRGPVPVRSPCDALPAAASTARPATATTVSGWCCRAEGITLCSFSQDGQGGSGCDRRGVKVLKGKFINEIEFNVQFFQEKSNIIFNLNLGCFLSKKRVWTTVNETIQDSSICLCFVIAFVT